MDSRSLTATAVEGNKMDSDVKQPEKDKAFRLKAAIFLSSVTGLSMLVGFGTTLAAAKKRDPAFFNRGLIPTRELPVSGSALAMKALGIGTLYAFTGCGILFYSIWKIMGVNDLYEFRMKVGSFLPRVPKNDPPQSRVEFEGLTDLLKYISEENSPDVKVAQSD
ncbi:transmembrane protein 242 [Ischnura elegans]|uniref:transmembrane protein 242 n=1 Tax=Ischnura elegans TaxID=197161 RepID=UPI001ED8B5AB|nr:transmembrane protein 242 [Ischnura elegans]